MNEFVAPLMNLCLPWVGAALGCLCFAGRAFDAGRRYQARRDRDAMRSRRGRRVGVRWYVNPL